MKVGYKMNGLIKGYPQGSDITVMNVTYMRPKKIPYYTEEGELRNKYGDDYLWIVYKDNKTGKKGHYTIKYPKYTCYISKKGMEKPYNQFFVDEEEVEPFTCKYRELEKSLYKKLGREKEWEKNRYSRNFAANSLIHGDPRVFSSDMNIEDYYRARFAELYTNNVEKIEKGFFDIEADTISMEGDFPMLGECPINCVSYYNEPTNTIYTFILHNPKNPLIEEFEKEAQEKKLYEELYEFVIDAVGGREAANEFGVGNVKQKFMFYDSEIGMLKDIFITIHKLSPDFVMAWNMAFDIPYVIERIVKLGYDPLDIMCDDSYENELKEVYYYIDERHRNELAERTDFARITGNVVWIDQMVQFAQKRKAKIGSFTSFKLDDIGNDTVGVRKLDYHHITPDISKLPYLDFKTFIFYNIMDVVVQKCIEARSKDIDYIFTNCLVNNTSYRKGYRQTVFLANRIIKEFKDKGYIAGNNINRLKAQMPGFKKPEKYAGAIVGDPLLVGDTPKRRISDTISMIADNVIDEDYKALYPSCELENNIAPNTQIGKINVWNDWHAIYRPGTGKEYDVWIMDLENAYDFPTYPADNKQKDPENVRKDKKDKRYKPVYLFQDKACTIPVLPELDTSVEYRPELFETISYERIYDGQNFNSDERYEAAGEFAENYMCQNSIIFSNRYFKFATFKQFIKEDLPKFIKSIGEKVIEKRHMHNPFIHVPEGKYNPFIEVGERDGKYNPFIQVDDAQPERELKDYIEDLKKKI